MPLVFVLTNSNPLNLLQPFKTPILTFQSLIFIGGLFKFNDIINFFLDQGLTNDQIQQIEFSMNQVVLKDLEKSYLIDSNRRTIMCLKYRVQPSIQLQNNLKKIFINNNNLNKLDSSESIDPFSSDSKPNKLGLNDFYNKKYDSLSSGSSDPFSSTDKSSDNNKFGFDFYKKSKIDLNDKDKNFSQTTFLSGEPSFSPNQNSLYDNKYDPLSFTKRYNSFCSDKPEPEPEPEICKPLTIKEPIPIPKFTDSIIDVVNGKSVLLFSDPDFNFLIKIYQKRPELFSVFANYIQSCNVLEESFDEQCEKSFEKFDSDKQKYYNELVDKLIILVNVPRQLIMDKLIKYNGHLNITLRALLCEMAITQ